MRASNDFTSTGRVARATRTESRFNDRSTNIARRKRSNRPTLPSSRRPYCVRLAVEALEDRVTPSLITVTNTSSLRSVAGSSRWAVTQANADTTRTPITIGFDASVSGTVRLAPQDLVIADAPTGVFPQFDLINPGRGGSFGADVETLSNGNLVVTDPTANGNYVVQSEYALPGNSSADRGAVTFGNGTTGVTGTISSANSLVGTNGGDELGNDGILTLPNGNYVVLSRDWNHGVGAATFGDGTTGVSGAVADTNSVVGSTAGDGASINAVALKNSNYVVICPDWNNDTGAATWGSGTAGVSGTIADTISLLGSGAGDGNGLLVTPLPGGNYVVTMPS